MAMEFGRKRSKKMKYMVSAVELQVTLFTNNKKMVECWRFTKIYGLRISIVADRGNQG